MKTLAARRAAVFGLGGVGSCAAEALARSGVGHLTLVDFDRVCVTNMNRQLHALTGTLGAPKAGLMAARVREINPGIEVLAVERFYDKTTSAELLDPRPDVVIDAIDNVTAKMHLVATCVRDGLPLVTALGSAAKLDPTRIRIVPLTATHTDPLGRALRKFTRRKHDATDEHLARVWAVFSDEPPAPAATAVESAVCGVNCVCPGGDNPHHTCARRRLILGSAMFVTAAFGMAAASAAIRLLLGMSPASPREVCRKCATPVGRLRRPAGKA